MTMTNSYSGCKALILPNNIVGFYLSSLGLKVEPFFIESSVIKYVAARIIQPLFPIEKTAPKLGEYCG